MVNAGGDIDLCKGNTNNHRRRKCGSNRSAPFDYTWNNASTLDNAFASKSESKSAGNHPYTVNVIDALVAQRSDVMNVVIFDPATVNLGTNPAICSGSNVTLVTSGATGGTATSATWSTPDGTGQFETAGGTRTHELWFGQAARYEPSANDYTNGRFTIRLTTNDPTGPCPAASGRSHRHR